MPIRTEYQAVVTCDDCWRNLVDAYMLQKEAIRAARRKGWKIGKRVTCPECQIWIKEG